jgi:hypothetical protein
LTIAFESYALPKDSLHDRFQIHATQSDRDAGAIFQGA